jgi:hypothetical protein
MRWLALVLMSSLMISSSAFAGGHHFGGQATVNLGVPVYLGPSWRQYHGPNTPYFPPYYRQFPTYSPYGYYPYYPASTYPLYQQPEPQPPPPEPQVIEREVVREVPAPAPAPQIIVVQQPAPPAPVVIAAPPPAPAEPPKAAAPRTPGPDVYSWTDSDGVVHYSTRVPADAKAKAKKMVAVSP